MADTVRTYEVSVPEERVLELEGQGHELITRAKVISVTNTDEFRSAAEFQKTIKALRNQITDFWKPIVGAAHASWRSLKDQENACLKPVTEAQEILARKLGEFTKKEAEAARERAEAERKRLEAEAQKARNAAVRDLAQKGHTEEALEALNADLPPVAVQERKPVKVEGTRTTTVWRYTVEDEAKIPREYLIPDEKKIGQVVRTNKDKTDIAGIKVYSETLVR